MTLLFPFNSGLPARLTAALLREDLSSQRSREKKEGGGKVREKGGGREGRKHWNEGISYSELKSEVKSLTGHFVDVWL